ncbi:DNA polymerase ligase N-terminal domain-containing protein [Legionella tunisiensis]|uniref:DNA polymerase ligase N-terminal domain-containing protein n=1 Tax=Legionella tunisiensis TaxID=1034944 RepID=UPI000317FF94|nr:DNA polymerase ligase N-terminal domain-containing protein [Legionella tunisiensis]
MSLERYHQKRNFNKTSEPKGNVHHYQQHRFYIQKHAASHLHYDFRLELDGVLKSWAIPKGPSLDPSVKRLAIHVEDHPIEYGNFEGIIPKGEYGGGTVMLWDKGEWESLDKNPLQAYKKGHLRFELHAEKLGGRWDLIRFKKEDKSWFLIKYKDNYARKDDYDITTEETKSVLSQQSIEEIEKIIKPFGPRPG